MKKRLFILAIIFCLCMMPKNTFAKTTVTLFTNSYSRVYEATLDKELFPPATPARRLRITWDNCNVSQNTVYDQYLDLGLSALYGYPSYSIGGFYVGSTYQNNSGTVQSVEHLQNGSTEFYERTHTTINFTATKTSNSCFWETEWSTDKQITYINLYNQRLTAQGNTTNDILLNSASSIMQNDNWNTYQQMANANDNSNRIINNQNKNTNDLINKQQENINAIKDLEKQQSNTNESIKDTDVSDANDEANSFFDDFKDDDYGLSDVITMPLKFIQGLSSSKCNSLNLPLPFVNNNLVLPCMTSIYSQYFGSFLTLYQIITTGFISYWVCLNIFRLVQGFKNPDNDEVEVMEL